MSAIAYPLSRFGTLPTAVSVFQPSPDDDTAVLQTLYRMEAIGNRSLCHPYVREAAHLATAHLPATATRRERAGAVWHWVRANLQFVQDENLAPGAREVLIEPPRLLTMPQPAGDCDDYTMLVSAMLASLGVPVRAVAVAADRSAPNRYSHVYAEAILEDGSRLPLDASHGAYPGWEAPHVYRRLPWRTLEAQCAGGLGYTSPWLTEPQNLQPWFQWIGTPVKQQAAGADPFPVWAWVMGLGLLALVILGGI